MHLYIALTAPRCPAGTYHWALVTASRTVAGIVNAYQIVENEKDSEWTLAHDRVRLAALPGLVGCVCLSTHVAERTEHIDAFLREFPAAQGRYRTDGGARWSCARWVMRCLENLVEAGIVELDMRALYETVEARGRQLEAEGRGSSAITVVDDVPIIAL